MQISNLVSPSTDKPRFSARVPGFAARSVASLQRWLAVVVVLFTFSAAGLLALIFDRHTALEGAVQAQFQLAAMQTGKEFRDFSHALELFALGHPDVAPDDVRLTYDIVSGRIDMMSQGLFGQALARDPEVTVQFGELAERIFGMEDDIARLDDADRQSVQPLLDQVAALDQPVARFETAVHQLYAEWLTRSREDILVLYRGLAVLFGALVVSVGAFVVLLWHQFRLIRNSERAAVLGQLAEGVIVADASGRITFVNDAAARLHGEAPEDQTSTRRFHTEDGRPYLSKDLPLARAVLRGETVADARWRIRRPDGTEVLAVGSARPVLSPDGTRMGAVLTFRDETARAAAEQALRESEQRLRATYEHATVGIAEVSASGRFLRVNEALCRILGYEREDLGGRTHSEVSHPDDWGRDATLFQRQLSGEIDEYSIEKRVFRKGGAVVWIAVSSVPVRGADDRFLYAVRVVQDITESRRAAEHQKLLVAELSHRVKNTLAAIQSIANQTLQGVQPEALRVAFVARLHALAQAHGLLSKTEWQGADLADVVRTELLPHGDVNDRILLDGPSLQIGPRAALTLGMAIHEMATNAAKYGGFSVPSGRIEVSWNVCSASDGEHLCLRWIESGGPPVRAPKRRGFGSTVIERGVVHELDGEVSIDFAPTGIRYTMGIPLSAMTTPQSVLAG